MFEEAQLTARLQDAANLGEEMARLGHRTQHQGDHGGIEGSAVERQRITVTGDDRDRNRRFGGGVFSKRASSVATISRFPISR